MIVALGLAAGVILSLAAIMIHGVRCGGGEEEL